MSLLDYVNYNKELIDRFDKPFFPKLGAIKAAPLTENYSTVGAAFDYIMRLRLAKLNSLQTFRCIAAFVASTKRQREVMTEFKRDRLRYMRGELDISAFYAYAIVMAKIDANYRSGLDYPDRDIFTVCKEDIIDLEHLNSLIVPEQWLAKKQCILNPTFGKSSLAVGGGDADLIVDERLIDIRCTKRPALDRAHFRQLVGYYLLNMRENDMYGTITSLEVYYARYGYIFTFKPPRLDKGGDMWLSIEASIRSYLDDMKALIRAKHEAYMLKLQSDPQYIKEEQSYIAYEERREEFMETLLSKLEQEPKVCSLIASSRIKELPDLLKCFSYLLPEGAVVRRVCNKLEVYTNLSSDSLFSSDCSLSDIRELARGKAIGDIR